MAPSSFVSAGLSDQELLATVHRLAADERHATAALIGCLAELDARRLYLGEGCSSLFTYCTQVLHLSEHAAYGRIGAARAARRFPMVLERLAEGALTLTAVGLLAPHLTMDNHRELLDAARHRTKRDVEQLVAALRPQPAAPSSVRKLPPPHAHTAPSIPPSTPGPSVQPSTSSPGAERTPPVLAAAPRRTSSVKPLAPERFKVQFTLDGATMALLQRAKALMRHRVPDGDVGAVFTHSLTVLVEALEKKKLAATARPRPSTRAGRNDSRAIPAAVRREVWARDEGRCAFVGTRGRCTETGFLEFHHVHPYAAGGEPVAANIEVRCRSHNQYEAELFFGAPPPIARERVAGWDYRTRSWTELADRTEAAEMMPESDYGFRPASAPEMRTYGQLFAHVAEGRFGTCATVRGVPNPAAGKNLERALSTKQEFLKALADSSCPSAG